MWLRCVCGLSLRAAMSSIIRWRSGLTVLVSLMGSSILSEVDEHLDSQDGALHPLLASFRLVKGLSALAPAQRAGVPRLCALARTAIVAMRQFGSDRGYSGHIFNIVDPTLVTHLGVRQEAGKE